MGLRSVSQEIEQYHSVKRLISRGELAWECMTATTVNTALSMCTCDSQGEEDGSLWGGDWSAEEMA